MSSPIIAPPLAGNVVGSVGANFVVAEWKDAGGPPGPPRWIAPLHLHRNDDEAWYVLEGSVVRSGGEGRSRGARRLCRFCAARHASHLLESGTGLVRYLLVMTSKIYSLIQDIHAHARTALRRRLRAVFEKHDSGTA